MKTRFYSFKKGPLSRGCQLCVQGRKSVLFVTGICPKHCAYCPISENKWQQDVVLMNEWKTKKVADMIEEVRLCRSKGMGVTGGDPLARLERTVRLIKAMKKEFGRSFHVHLYTPLVLVDENKLKKLYDAGLDEIRLHPDIDNPCEWGKIELAKSFSWVVGIEIPALPGRLRETKKLLDSIDVDFLNINELEISDTNAWHMDGMKTKDKLSYAIKGSQEVALKLLKYSRFPTHYCTSKLKDAVQLRKRIALRAKSVKKPYDQITKDGTLIRGAVYGNLKKTIAIMKSSDVPIELYEKDGSRVLTSYGVVDALKDDFKEKGLRPAIVEEYPTHDQLNIVTDFLE